MSAPDKALAPWSNNATEVAGSFRALGSAFDASYYQTGNYSDYADRRDRYLRTAAELAAFLGSIGLASDDRVIDYGCATGHMIAGLQAAGLTNVAGVDISEWAVGECVKQGFEAHTSAYEANGEPVHALFALDVFEHMTDEAIRDAIRALDPRIIVARIPCSTDGGKTFHLAVSRKDPTHINCRTKENWRLFFSGLGDRGYATFPLRLFTVYDSLGVACILAVRK